MKNILKTLAVLALLTGSANAAVAVGDLILGFRLGDVNSASGSDNYLQIDLGSISSFTTAGTGAFATGGYSLNISSYLVSAYGANWNTNSSLSFGILGTTASTSSGANVAGGFNVWTSAAAAGKGLSADYANLDPSVSQLGTARSVVFTVNQLYTGMNSQLTQYASNSAVVLGTNVLSISQNTAGTGSNINTWGYAVDSGSSFNHDVFTNNITQSEYTQSVTAGQNYIDLRTFQNGDSSSTYAGTFILGSDGVLTVAPTAVPEPSTYGLIGAGALAGVAAVRRRRKAKVA